jgi:hypothetical protein
LGSGGYSIVLLNRRLKKVLKIIREEQLNKSFKIFDLLDEFKSNKEFHYLSLDQEMAIKNCLIAIDKDKKN